MRDRLCSTTLRDCFSARLKRHAGTSQIRAARAQKNPHASIDEVGRSRITSQFLSRAGWLAQAVVGFSRGEDVIEVVLHPFGQRPDLFGDLFAHGGQ